MKIIITGATGMVGEGVLLECFSHADMEQILVINRRAGGVSHPKMREIIVPDFFDLSPLVAELAGYDACFFCAGVSSVGMSAADYKRVTYDLTLSVAEALAGVNPDIGFCYVTGMGTDAGGKGWARVKGETEAALLALLPNAYMFRPGFMKASAGQRHLQWYYRYIGWVYPLGRRLYPRAFCTLREVGLAMMNVVARGYETRVLEVGDIVKAAGA